MEKKKKKKRTQSTDFTLAHILNFLGLKQGGIKRKGSNLKDLLKS